MIENVNPLVTFLERVNQRSTVQLNELSSIINTIKTDRQLYVKTLDYREKLKNLTTRQEISIEKATTFPCVAFAGEFESPVNDADIQKLSGLIVLDYDHLNDDQVVELIEKFKKNYFVNAVFVSPSGKGIKVLVKHNLTDTSKWKGLFFEVNSYFNTQIGVFADGSGKNIGRLCYICGDPNIYFNENSFIFEFKDIMTKADEVVKNNVDTSFKKKELTDELHSECLYKAKWLKENSISIADDYEQWLAYGFSLAAFGERGREIFHTISSVSEKYNKKECDYQYDLCLKDYQGDRSGIEKYINHVSKIIVEHLSKKINSNTYFPNADFYNNLPESCYNLLRFNNNPKQKFMGMMSFFSAASAIMPNYKMWHYDRYYHSNLFLWITADSGQGKNIIHKMSELTNSIHENLTTDYKREWAKWMEKSKTAELKGELFVERPPHKKGLRLGEDTTKAGIVKFMNRSSNAFLSTTEASTVVGSNKSNYGDFLDILLKSYEHETITKTLANEDFSIKRPQLSLTLSSTKGLLYNFFSGDNLSNGLFSRFLSFEVFPDELNNNYSQSNVSKEMSDLDTMYHQETSANFLKIYQELNDLDHNQQIEFKMTDAQNIMFDQYFTGLKRNFMYVYNIDPDLIKRLAVNFKRMLMVISLFRKFEEFNTLNYVIIQDNGVVVSTDTDFEFIKSIFKIYEISFVKLMNGIKVQQYTNTPLYKRNDLIHTLYIEGEKVSNIAKWFDLPTQKVYEIINNINGNKLIRLQVVEKLIEFGMSKKDIATLFNVTERQINNVVKDKDLAKKLEELSK
jgi:predicted XRE-type DNA-binding protein